MSAKSLSSFWIVLLLVVFCLDGRAGQSQAQTLEGIRTDGRLEFIDSEGRVLAAIAIEIADSSKSHRRGLMERTGLDDTMGMLFVFKDAKGRGFWMRDTPTSLDIIFVSAQQRVLNIAADTTPLSDTVYTSEGPAQFVVEVAAGFCQRHGIGKGALIRWQRN